LIRPWGRSDLRSPRTHPRAHANESRSSNMISCQTRLYYTTLPTRLGNAQIAIYRKLSSLPLYKQLRPTHQRYTSRTPSTLPPLKRMNRMPKRQKALSLQILAIDTLKIGLGLSSLSDTERVTFGLLFGKIGIQVVQALRAGDRIGKGKEERGVDHQKLLQDIEEQVNISVRTCIITSAYANDRWPLLAKALISCYYASSLSY
jgi:hypothetical protein